MTGNEASVRQALRNDEPSQAVDMTLAVTSRFPQPGDWPLGRTRIVAVVQDAVYCSMRAARRRSAPRRCA